MTDPAPGAQQHVARIPGDGERELQSRDGKVIRTSQHQTSIAQPVEPIQAQSQWSSDLPADAAFPVARPGLPADAAFGSDRAQARPRLPTSTRTVPIWRPAGRSQASLSVPIRSRSPDSGHGIRQQQTTELVQEPMRTPEGSTPSKHDARDPTATNAQAQADQLQSQNPASSEVTLIPKGSLPYMIRIHYCKHNSTEQAEWRSPETYWSAKDAFDELVRCLCSNSELGDRTQVHPEKDG